MGPVLSREVIKGEQPLFVFFQAVGCFWVLGLVTGDELIISLQSGFSCRRQIHFVDQLFCTSLNALGHFIQHVARFIHPTTFLSSPPIFFLERPPTPHSTIPHPHL